MYNGLMINNLINYNDLKSVNKLKFSKKNINLIIKMNIIDRTSHKTLFWYYFIEEASNILIQQDNK